ncbi:MAG: diaminopimelate epimerase [Alphaproteobacteria bacterium]|jgi:diaminopimelate epimerase|nr:diaminopimelate epimerase [Alphaproteobacteria bacterium]
MTYKKIPFFKMTALGNDFIFLDKKYFFDVRNHVKLMCDRKYGIGCDQLLVYVEDITTKTVHLDIINNDGSVAEVCGNGFRCAGDYFCSKNGWDSMEIIASGKTYHVEYKEGVSYVNMGKPLLKTITIVDVDLKHYGNCTYVNVGNPHVVLLGEHIERADVLELGKIIENHKMFPKKTNVNFARVINRKNVEIETWERGIGYSESCGSGATATAAALFNLGLIDRVAKIGGLNVSIVESDIIISGKTLFIFDGIYTI